MKPASVMKNLHPIVFHLILLMAPVRYARDLGAVYRISLDAIMPDKKKSVNEGGIASFGR